MPDPSIVAGVLARAIEGAANTLLAKVHRRHQWTTRQFRSNVAASKASLELLGQLKTPDYDDELVAALYLLRYHFSHVNLAWSTLVAANHLDRNRRPTNSTANGMTVSDHGAGTWALLFGLALHASDELNLGRDVGPFTVYPYERAPAMSAAGREVWKEFCLAIDEAANRYPLQLEALQKVIGRTSIRFPSEQPDLRDRHAHHKNRLPKDSIQWLTAFHAYYPDEDRNFRVALRNLADRVQPSHGLITCHKENSLLIRAAAPFGGEPHYLKPEPQLPETTLEQLDDYCRRIGFVRYPESPHRRQVYATWSSPLSDTHVLYWNSQEGV